LRDIIVASQQLLTVSPWSRWRASKQRVGFPHSWLSRHGGRWRSNVIFIDDQILDGYALYVGKDVEPDRLLYYKALCPQISCVGWAQGGAATCPL
jgi:hypothetical protein